MPEPMAVTLAAAALLAVLTVAVVSPRRPHESVVAVPAAGLLVLLGVVTPEHALDELRTLGPTIGFLAAVLVLAHVSDEEGVFRYAGALVGLACRGHPVSLLRLVFVAASLVTAALSLDATIVLLTPVVFATAARVRLRPRPHIYACAHLANATSLLLPVSNLTNLLAFPSTGLSFLGFTALMPAPWAVAILVEYAVFRRFFDRDLGVHSEPGTDEERPERPTFALVVLGLTLVAFGAVSFVDVDPVWPAAVAAAVLGVRRLARRRTTWRRLGSAASVPFLLFVLGLSVVVRGLQDNGLSALVARLLPDGSTLPALLATAAIAAVLANLVNNLPAVLVLAPAAAAVGPGPVLAVLIGVNLGPNLTYVGSLATLLWRRVSRHHGSEPVLREYLLLGVATTPLAIVAATVALWTALHVAGI